VTGFIVVVSGGFGAGLRFVLSSWVTRRFSAVFPWGTAVVNAAGALLLGGAVGAGLNGHTLSAVVGTLSGFTTYSTWSVESVSLWREGRSERLPAAINYFGLFATGMVLAWLGWVLGRALG